MDIKEALMAEHSKAQIQLIADYIGNDPDRFASLVALIIGGGLRLAQRAAWALSHCADRNPEMILPHLAELLSNLRKNVHVGVRRNTLRVLQKVEIPEDLLGEAADICFMYLASHDETVAVKVFSMTVLANICEREPDLGNELRLLIEEQLPYGTAGFKSRAKKVLAELQ